MIAEGKFLVQEGIFKEVSGGTFYSLSVVWVIADLNPQGIETMKPIGERMRRFGESWRRP